MKLTTKIKTLLVAAIAAAGLSAFSESVTPSVTIDEAKSVKPWNSEKGEVAVDYSLGGLDAGGWYKIAFDITANGETKGVTNAAAKLAEGAQTQQTIETVALFGEEKKDKEAKVKVSLIAVPPPKVKYLDWDADQKKLVEKTVLESECESVTAGTSELAEGKIYIVKDEVVTAGLVVNGTEAKPTTLVLCDGAKLTAKGGSLTAGVAVASGNALVICGQELGTGALEATGGSSAAGIGGGNGVAGGTVTVNGGIVTAQGGMSGAGIGGGNEVAGGTVTVNGGVVTATGGKFGAGIGGGSIGAGGTVTVNGGAVTATGGQFGVGIGGGSSSGGKHGTVAFGEGKAFLVKAGADAGSATEVTPFTDFSSNHSQVYAHIEEVAVVKYMAWDADQKKLVEKTVLESECGSVTAGTSELAEGKIYIVKDEVVTAGLVVNGTEAKPTTLVLCDGAKLTAKGNSAGIAVASGNALVICGQELGTGALEATGGQGKAGIGGVSGDGGTVTVNGGVVTATGGQLGAGIGGWGNGGAGGTVTVNGGVVTATGGKDGGAGIGGGYYGAGGTVTINGGVVTATGKNGGVGIGAGSGSSSHGKVEFGAGKEFTVKAGADAGSATEVTPFTAFSSSHSQKYAHIEVPSVKYMDWDANLKKLVEKSIPKTECEFVTTSTKVLEEGKTYVVTNTMTRKASTSTTTRTSPFTVNGTPAKPTRLIVCDGVTMTVYGRDRTAGFAVTNGHALVICGQCEQTDRMGALVVTSGIYGAAIGGWEGLAGGTVTFNSVNVNTLGGVNAASIGSGGQAKDGPGDGGTVTINGGVVMAQGGKYGAGIGGGRYGAGGTVTINGGVVTSSGNAAAAIGAGYENFKKFGNGTLAFCAGKAFTVKAGAGEGSATNVTAAAFAADHDQMYAHIEEVAAPQITAEEEVFAFANEVTEETLLAFDETMFKLGQTAIEDFKDEVGAKWDDAAKAGVPAEGFAAACDNYTDKESFLTDMAEMFADDPDYYTEEMIGQIKAHYLNQLDKCIAVEDAVKGVDEELAKYGDPSDAVKAIAAKAKADVRGLYGSDKFDQYETPALIGAAAKEIKDRAAGDMAAEAARERAIKDFKVEVGAKWDDAAKAGVPAEGFAVACDGYTDKESFLTDMAEMFADDPDYYTAGTVGQVKAHYLNQLDKCIAVEGAVKGVDEELAKYGDPSDVVKAIAAKAKADIRGLYGSDQFDQYETPALIGAAAREIKNRAADAMAAEAAREKAIKDFKVEVGAKWDDAAKAGVPAEGFAAACEGYTDKESFLTDMAEMFADDPDYYTVGTIGQVKAHYLNQLDKCIAVEGAVKGVDEELAKYGDPSDVVKAIAAKAKADIRGLYGSDKFDQYATPALIAAAAKEIKDRAAGDMAAEVVREKAIEDCKAAVGAAWDNAVKAGVPAAKIAAVCEGYTDKDRFLADFEEAAYDEWEIFTIDYIKGLQAAYVGELNRQAAIAEAKAQLGAAWDAADKAGVDFEATKDCWEGCTTKEAFLANFEEAADDEKEIFTIDYIKKLAQSYADSLAQFASTAYADAIAAGKKALGAKWDAAEEAGVDFVRHADDVEGCTTKEAFLENFEGMFDPASDNGKTVRAQYKFYLEKLDNLIATAPAEAMADSLALLDAAWDAAEEAGVDFEATKDYWEGCATKEAFLANFEEMFGDGATAPEIRAQAAFYKGELERQSAIALGKAAMAEAWDAAEARTVDFEATKDLWDGCTTKEAFLANFEEAANDEREIFTVDYIKALVENYVAKLNEVAASVACAIVVADGGKRLGEADPTSLATNFTVTVNNSRYTAADFGGYCARAKGEAAGEYAINFVCTRRPEGFPEDALTVQPGVFTIGQPEMLDASGAVTLPKVDSKTGYLKENSSASWKAKADKGCVFAGWVAVGDAPAAFAALSANEHRQPSLSLKVAKGERIAPDCLKATWARIDEDTIDAVALAANGLVVDTKSYVTASVSGLPSGLRFNAKSLAITGELKAKDKDYTVKVSVKNASGYTLKQSFVFVVQGGALAEIVPAEDQVTTGVSLMLWCDTAMGSVSGTGVYALSLDKKSGVWSRNVWINASAKSGYVFAGWYEDPGFSTPARFWTGSGSTQQPKDYRNEYQTVTVTGPTYLFARFVEKTTKADPITWLRYEGAGYCGAVSDWLAEDETWYQGVALPSNACRIAFGSLSLPTVSVSGLPSGVKFDKATCCLTGVPTAASTEKKPFFTVKVSVKNRSGATDVLTKNVAVKPLPGWAVGNFDGGFFAEGQVAGTVALTVGSTGKVSGKTLAGGKSYSFSAAAFDSVDKVGDALRYCAKPTVKVSEKVDGKTVTVTKTLTVVLAENENTGLGEAEIAYGEGDGTSWAEVVQNGWKRKDLDPALPAFPSGKNALSLVTDEGLTLKFGSNGSVSVSGKLDGDNGKQVSVSATAQVLPFVAEGDKVFAQLSVYVAPKSNFAAGFAKVYELALTVGADGKFGAVAFRVPND